MSKQTKIIIGVVAGISVLCLISCVVGFLVLRNVGSQVVSQVEESTNTDPDAVNTDAASMAEFTLPPGYNPETSTNLLGFKMAMYTNPENNHFLSLIQMPGQSEISEESIRQMREGMERRSSRGLQNLQTVEQRELTIRGKPAQLIIQEGTNDGTPVRQMLVVFQGKGGLTMLMVMGAANTWDQAAYNNLVTSIH